MKTGFAFRRFSLLAIVFLGLCAGFVSAAEDPIPGIDVVVRKKPSGASLKITTDKTGKFNFSALRAGTYELAVTVSQVKSTSINTTRSNIKHPNLSVANGVQVATVAVTIGAGQPDPVEIVLSADGGTITGLVTAETNTAVEKSPAKPLPGAAKKTADVSDTK